MPDWSICGECWCSPETICGYLPRYPAVCGRAICSPYTICGYGIPIEDEITTPENRKLNAIAKIFKSSGSIFTIDLVSATINITNPCDNDEASIECIDNETLEVGDRTQIWIGYPSKYLAFVGDIKNITRDEEGITKAFIECIVDKLKYKYLGEDKSFSGITRKSAVLDILTDYHSGIDYELDIKPDVSFILTKDYWSWDNTILDIIKDIMWDHNIYYIYKTLYIENPNTEINLTLDYERSKFQSWSMMEEQNNQFGIIHVDGADHSKDKYCYNQGVKEFSFNDMTLTTQEEVDRVANILAEEKNRTLYNVTITLPYLIPPRIGRVNVKLPGLDKKLIIKAIRYEISGTSLSSTLTLGSHRSPITSVMNKIIQQGDKSHFIW